jgi:hypothetical protein
MPAKESMNCGDSGKPGVFFLAAIQTDMLGNIPHPEIKK